MHRSHMMSALFAGAALALFPIAISSPAVGQAPPTSPQAPAAAAAKPFTRAEYQGEALRFEARIRQESQALNRPVPQLLREADQAQQRGDLKQATDLLAAVVVQEPNNLFILRRLSDLYRQVNARDDWRLRSEMQQRSTAAAYLAYQRARTREDEARALWFLAESLAARFQYRPALDALRISLDTSVIPEVRTRYEALLDQHGFRILSYQVDSDTASPRICFEFSEQLRPRLDAAPYVRMPNGVPGTVTADGSQLCVDGLKHGERYDIQLRAGLPSAVQENLRRAADYQIYVRDRTPVVRFTGRNYVLPRTGQQGLPVVSVNLSEVRLAIHRIGDRSIAPTVLDERFLGALDGEQARKLATERGTPVWSGVLQTENRLNEEVVTAFPVSEALGDALAPGIYVMVASRADVPEDGERSWEPRSTQWFVVSDLGLATVTAGDGLHAEVRSLTNAEPLAGVELRLIARNNEVLGTGRTDAQGRVRFEPGLTRGEGGLAPGVLVAQREGDYALLPLATAAFDLTDRGVTGRPAPGPLDAFVVTERGVYRSGETVHVTALLRNDKAEAVTGVPLTLVLERPDGVEARRVVLEDAGQGGRVLSQVLPAGAPTGTWRLKALVDPRRPPVGQATFLVEDYVPDRLELTLESRTSAISQSEGAVIDVNGRWLFGAPAADLAIEGETIVSATDTVPGLEGYRVGLQDEQIPPVRRALADLPRTNREGRARVTVPLPELPSASRPLQVETLLRLTEGSGRGVERKLTFQVAQRRPWVGVRPLFDALGDGETATFDVRLLGADGRLAAARGVRWELSRVETRFQWFRTDGRWSYQSVTSARRVADGRIDVSAGEAGRIASRLTWGRYRLDVTSSEGGAAATSVLFNVGFFGTEVRADSPDVLDVALDKERYAAGETARLRINSRFEGQATVAVLGDRVNLVLPVRIAQGQTTVDVPVGNDWGTGAYVAVTAFRPLDQAARRQPGRAIGIRWLAIDPAPRTIGVTLEVPDQIAPRGTLRVPVRLANVAGEEARITIAAVDVGILNLTGYRAPDPGGFYYGQRALGAEMRDLYGFLIDGMQGTRGRIRAGGDGAAELQGSPPAQAPVALFSGVVPVGADGTATVELEVPAFAGTLRLMAVAWTAGKVGSTSRDVIVRDPVVLTGTLPRFLATGDRSRFLVEVHNVEGAPGDYTVSLDVSGPVIVPVEALRRTLRLDRNQRSAVTIPVTAAGIGRATFEVTVAGPGGAATAQTFGLTLRPATPVITRRTIRPLNPDGTLELSADLLADVIPGTGAVSVSINAAAALDVPGLVQQLDRYPFGCTEQTISRALPLLYLSSLVPRERDLGLQEPVEDIIRAAVERVMMRQASNGTFGLWGVGGRDLWLDAYVGDFLTRARERGVTVPRAGFEMLLDRLRNAVANQNDGGGGDDATDGPAYALYVLARNGRPVIGDLRYMADAKRDEIGYPLAQAQVAAGLALLGDRGRAQPLFQQALDTIANEADEPGRTDYGSHLRDAAGILALLGDAEGTGALRQRALSLVSQQRNARRGTSTQEAVWLVLAAQAGREAAAQIQLDVAGETRTGAFARTYRPSDLQIGNVTLRNRGTAPVQAVVAITGATATPEPPTSQGGFTIERTYRRMDGRPADVRQVRQNERFLVTIKVTEAEPRFGRVVIEDRLPAGFEIDSPSLVQSANTRGVPAQPAGEGEVDGEATDPETGVARPVATEFRDERFVAAFDRNDGAPQEFTVSYIVRAVAPGTYAHPGVVIEDMYDPQRVARTASGTVEVVQAP